MVRSPAQAPAAGCAVMTGGFAAGSGSRGHGGGRVLFTVAGAVACGGTGTQHARRTRLKPRRRQRPLPARAARRLPDCGQDGRARSPAGVDRGRHGEALAGGTGLLSRAVNRVAALAGQPGVAGIKIADELGYNDGMDSAGKIKRFLSDTARALHAAAPHKLILVDMVCHSSAACLATSSPCPPPRPVARRRMPLPRARPYRNRQLPAHARDRRARSQHRAAADSTYAAGAPRRCGADRRLAGGAPTRLAQPGPAAGPQGARASGKLSRRAGPGGRGHAPVRRHPDRLRRPAVDIWTWHQEYEGAMYQLMNPGMRPNALWISSNSSAGRAMSCSPT